MARIDDHLFKIDVGIAETHLRFRAGRDKFFYKLLFAIGNADPFSSAAGYSLDENREAEFPRLFEASSNIGDNTLGTGNHRAFHASCRGFRRGFIAEQSDRSGGGPDEIQAAAFADRGEIGVFA